MENHYKKALEAAKKEMSELLPQHTAIEKRIAMLRQTIATLTALSEDPDPDTDQVFIPSEFQQSVKHAIEGFTVGMMGTDMALSDAVREVLKASGRPMTSIQVRDGLIRMGIDIENKYTSPLAVIHKALKRLDEKGEVATGTSPDGKSTYKWVAQSPRWHKQMKEAAVKTQNPLHVTLPDPPMPPKRYRVTPKEVKKKD